jgi:hypothetical protein
MKELLQYSKELKEFRRSGGLPQGDIKNELAKIYEDNWRERWGSKEVNRSCPGCVRDMMKILTYEFEQMQKEYKFEQAQKKVSEQKQRRAIDLDKSLNDLEREFDDMLNSIDNIEEHHAKPFITELEEKESYASFLNSMKWGELRKYATSKGVNTKGKNKQQILDELNG